MLTNSFTTRIGVGFAVVAALTLTGCGVSNTEAPTPTVEAPAPMPEATEPTLEESAQVAASTLDPVFADPAVWESALTLARSDCALADADPANAFEVSVRLGMENGVSAERLGIVWGVAVTLYCPEHADLLY